MLDACLHGAPQRGPPPADARGPLRCASLPEPIRSSSAKNCLRRPIRSATKTTNYSAISACEPSVMRSPEASPLLRRLDGELASLEANSQLRHLEILPDLNCSSNDYLGLSVDPRLREAVAEALAAGGPVGSTGSRLLSGHAAIWEELESQLAPIHRRRSGFVFQFRIRGPTLACSALFCSQTTSSFLTAPITPASSTASASPARAKLFSRISILTFSNTSCAKAARAPGKDFCRRNCFQHGRRPRAAAGTHRARGSLRRRAYGGTKRTRPECSARRGAVLWRQRRLKGASSPRCTRAGKRLQGWEYGQRFKNAQAIPDQSRAWSFIFSTALPPYLAAQIRSAIGTAASADAERERLATLAAHLVQLLAARGWV